MINLLVALGSCGCALLSPEHTKKESCHGTRWIPVFGNMGICVYFSAAGMRQPSITTIGFFYWLGDNECVKRANAQGYRLYMSSTTVKIDYHQQM
ncbi:hypothetical protein BJV82DRAFT_606817 [Fennellomyces sp. T-0311]|nr:hypothetical protein BJV82DRAFT_606817 [Fennellomyces sp. T-0311]